MIIHMYEQTVASTNTYILAYIYTYIPASVDLLTRHHSTTIENVILSVAVVVPLVELSWC